jgi:membrane-bound lytic murein transglycosylase B
MRMAWLMFLLSFSAIADRAFTQRDDVQLFIKNTSQTYHFTKQELTETMNHVQLQPKIIEAMDKPYEKKNWDVYRDLFLTPQRINAGIDFWRANQNTLAKAQKIYGVPAEIIVAILGVETLYGTHQGQYRVLDALATLAFNYPKRAPYFTKELQEYLLLCREHKVPATQYLGSYAGAIGQPQFMPGSYRYYAVDFNNKGKRDLINNNDDVIGSVANYFQKHGWQTNAEIVQQAQLHGYHYRHIVMNPKTVNYNYTQLEAAGIKPVTATWNHPQQAALLEFLTNEGKEYWLAYPNFFVITRYNTSPQYALVVYLLSQKLKADWANIKAKQYKAYA